MSNSTTMPYVWHNGKITALSSLPFTPDISFIDQSYIIGNVFTSGTEILFAEESFKNLFKIKHRYDFDSRLLADTTAEFLSNEIKRLLIRNFFYKIGVCILLIHENHNGIEQDEIMFIQPAEYLASMDNMIRKIVVAIDYPKPKSDMFMFPSIMREYKKILAVQLKCKGAEDCIIVDQQQNILETYLGNIYLIDGFNVYTPSLQTGCTDYLIRRTVISSLKQLNFNVHETDNLSAEMLFEVTEVLIAGNEGIFSLKGIEYKRFFDSVRRPLIEKIFGS